MPENVKKLPSFMQCYSGRHSVTLLNLLATTGLSILLHGVISLPEVTSCVKETFNSCLSKLFFTLTVLAGQVF